MNKTYHDSTLFPVIITIPFEQQTYTAGEQKEVYSSLRSVDYETPEYVLKEFFSKSMSLVDKTVLSAKKTYPHLFK